MNATFEAVIGSKNMIYCPQTHPLTHLYTCTHTHTHMYWFLDFEPKSSNRLKQDHRKKKSGNVKEFLRSMQWRNRVNIYKKIPTKRAYFIHYKRKLSVSTLLKSI